MVQLMLQKPLEHLGSQQGLSKDNIVCSGVCTEGLSSQVLLKTIHNLPKQDLPIRENTVVNKFQIHEYGKSVWTSQS